MQYGSALGWGVVMYAVLALSWSGIALYGLSTSPVAILLQIFVLIVVAAAATRSLKFHMWPDMLPYSLTWAGVAIALDIVYKVPFFGWSIFSDWSFWVIYGLIAVVPLITLKKKSSKKVAT